VVSHAESTKQALSLAEAEAEAEAPAQASNTSVLRALVEQHYGSVTRLLRRLGVRPAQLDDAAQEVFWIAARRLADIQPGKGHAFLYGVALRVAAQETRRQRQAEPIADLEAVPRLRDLEPSPEEQLERRQARELLDTILDACRQSYAKCWCCSSSRASKCGRSPSCKRFRWARRARACAARVKNSRRSSSVYEPQAALERGNPDEAR
jgi:DNA-directed RNA polymerase specialized sigma24 family protein